MQILIIDDNPADVELLRRALTDAGIEYDLAVVEDGAEALALAQRSGNYAQTPLPDLAIVDLNLPKHNGLEILEAMRANRSFDEVLVVVLSSSASPRERAAIDKFGVARYILKPPDLEEFMRIGWEVKELLNSVSRATPQGPAREQTGTEFFSGTGFPATE